MSPILRFDRKALAKSATPQIHIAQGWCCRVHDPRSRALETIDFSTAVCVNSLRDGEDVISGEERLRREKREDDKLIRLDFVIEIALLAQVGQATLKYLYAEKNVTHIEFTGARLSTRVSREWYFSSLVRAASGLWCLQSYVSKFPRTAESVSVRIPVSS